MWKLVAITLGIMTAVVSCHPSTAGETVTIGGVEIPVDCALARHEHPRLLFTKADLPRLRQRLPHPRIAAELEHAKQLAADHKAGATITSRCSGSALIRSTRTTST